MVETAPRRRSPASLFVKRGREEVRAIESVASRINSRGNWFTPRDATSRIPTTFEVTELVHPFGICRHGRPAWVDFTENRSAALSDHDVLHDRRRSDGDLLRDSNRDDH